MATGVGRGGILLPLISKRFAPISDVWDAESNNEETRGRSPPKIVVQEDIAFKKHGFLTLIDKEETKQLIDMSVELSLAVHALERERGDKQIE